jgi:hypothetical protein
MGLARKSAGQARAPSCAVTADEGHIYKLDS